MQQTRYRYMHIYIYIYIICIICMPEVQLIFTRFLNNLITSTSLGIADLQHLGFWCHRPKLFLTFHDCGFKWNTTTHMFFVKWLVSSISPVWRHVNRREQNTEALKKLIQTSDKLRCLFKLQGSWALALKSLWQSTEVIKQCFLKRYSLI